MPEVNHPFSYEVSRNFLIPEIQSEDIGNLCSKDSDGNTAGEAHNDGIRNKLDNCSQFEHSQQNEDDTCHQRCYDQSRFSILLDDTINNNDEGTGRSADLYFASSKKGNDETSNDSRDNAFFR